MALEHHLLPRCEPRRHGHSLLRSLRPARRHPDRAIDDARCAVRRHPLRRRMAIAKVEPLTTARALRGPFDYRLPERLGGVSVGTVLLVPFGRRRVIGVVVEHRRVERAGARSARRADPGAGGRCDARARPAGPLGGPRVLLDPCSRAGAGAAPQRGPRREGRGPRLETYAAATEAGRAALGDGSASGAPASRAGEAGRRASERRAIVADAGGG